MPGRVHQRRYAPAVGEIYVGAGGDQIRGNLFHTRSDRFDQRGLSFRADLFIEANAGVDNSLRAGGVAIVYGLDQGCVAFLWPRLAISPRVQGRHSVASQQIVAMHIARGRRTEVRVTFELSW